MRVTRPMFSSPWRWDGLVGDAHAGVPALGRRHGPVQGDDVVFVQEGDHLVVPAHLEDLEILDQVELHAAVGGLEQEFEVDGDAAGDPGLARVDAQVQVVVEHVGLAAGTVGQRLGVGQGLGLGASSDPTPLQVTGG